MSEWGLRLRNPNGAVTMDDSMGIVRMLGVTTVEANTSGAISNALFATATPFYLLYPQHIPPASYDANLFPRISFDGNQTLSYTSGKTPCTLVHGVYAGTSRTEHPAPGYGLRVRNASGVPLIDNKFSNLFFSSKHSISLAEGKYVYLTVGALVPVIAYRGTGMVAIAGMKLIGANQWQVAIQGSASSSTVGMIYVFDIALNGAQLDAANYGMRLRDASGNVIFDSRMMPANIAGTGAINVTQDDYVDEVALARDNLAVIISPGFFFFNNTA